MLIGYARVSKANKDRDGKRIGQTTDPQIDALTEAGCVKIYSDEGVSGRKASRPQWDILREHALHAGDVLVITKLDRIARSTANLHAILKELQEKGVDLRVLHQPIDTTTSTGKLMFTMLGAFAEFEADIIRERTMEGLEAARSRGRVGGAKPKLTKDAESVARTMHETGSLTGHEIARTLGVSRSTYYRSLRRTAV